MNERWIGIALVLSSFFCTVDQCRAEEEAAVPFAAKGEAAIVSGNAARARAEALEKALGNAVGLMSEQLLSPAIAQKNTKLIAKLISESPRELVRDYRMVRESTSQGVLSMEVSVMIRREKVRSKLVRYGILYERTKRPRIGFAILEERRGNTQARTAGSKLWTSLLIDRLRDLNYEVGEPAEIQIAGNFALHGKDTITLELHATLAKPIVELASIRTNLAIDGDPNLAAAQLAAYALEKILPAWYRQLGEGKAFLISVRGFSSFRVYKEFRDALTSGRGGYSSAMEKVFEPARVTFEVVYDGTTIDLVKAITRIPLTGTKLYVGQVNDQSVEFEAK